MESPGAVFLMQLAGLEITVYPVGAIQVSCSMTSNISFEFGGIEPGIEKVSLMLKA